MDADPRRPLSSDGLTRRAAPFLLVIAIAFAGLGVVGHTTKPHWTLAAGVATAALVALGALVPWRRLPAWTEAPVPLGFLGVVFLLREAGGGAASGYSQTAVLPVVWLAMYGTRRQTLVSAAGLVLSLLVPVLAMHYPHDELRRVLMWAALAPMLGLSIHGLVERLRASEQRREEIFTAVREVVFETDAQGRWTSLSPAYETVTGYPVASALGHGWFELTHPADIQPTVAAFAALRAGEVDSLTRDNRIHVADGSVLWIGFRAHARRDASGAVIGFAGTMRDVTDRKELERELEADRAFSRAVLEQLGTRVVVADAEGRLQVFNGNPHTSNDRVRGLHSDRWAETFDIRCPRTGELLAPEDVPLARALHGDEPVPDTELLVGGRRYLVGASPITGRLGERLGAVASMLDIEDLRAAEQEAAEHAADLEAVARVARRLAAEQSEDAVRADICAAAREAAGGSIAVLFEPDAARERFVTTGTDGLGGDVRPSIPIDGVRNGTSIAFATRAPFFVSDLASEHRVDRATIAAMGLESALWFPVVHDGRSVGVLAVGWRTPRADLGGRTLRLLDLLATEAAIAIDRTRLIAELEATARTDALTGVSNRRTWDERLPEELARARRTGEPVCVAVLDLDRFKLYNDTNGHQAGDQLLRSAAAAWRDELRTTDVLARYGGEEFTVALPACGVPAAMDVLERLRARIPLGQTASVGIALWDGHETAEQLVSRADAALYRAKRRGRDRIVLAPERAPQGATASTQILRTARRMLGMDVAFLSELRDDRLVLRDLDGDAEPHGYAVDGGGAAEGSYCARVLDGRLDSGVVADARSHPVTRDLDSTRAERIGAYIGAPIKTSDGRWLGMLCGVSLDPRPDLSTEDEALLADLAQLVADDLERELRTGADGTAAVTSAWSRTLGTLGQPLP